MQGISAYISCWLRLIKPLKSCSCLKRSFRFFKEIVVAYQVLTALLCGLNPCFAVSLSICTDDAEPHQRELIEDFLALELTLLPGIIVTECEEKTNKKAFFLRQTVLKKNNHLIVRMALINPGQEIVWEKIDFIEQQSRQKMVARAKFFAQEIAGVMFEPRMYQKPLVNLLEPNGATSVIEPEDSHGHLIENLEKNPFEYKNSWLVSVGLSTKTHFASKGLFEEHRDRVASKPYFIAGLDYTRHINRFALLGSIFGALSSTELRRPLPSPEMGPLHIKNLDILLSCSYRFIDLLRLKVGIGLDVGYYFFASAVQREKKMMPVSRYFSFREGLSLFLIEHFDLFASNLFFKAGYSPLVQNSDAKRAMLKNYGWQFSAGVESSLYRSFMLALTIAHGGESFLSSDNEKRIVRYQNLAYMGLLTRI